VYEYLSIIQFTKCTMNPTLCIIIRLFWCLHTPASSSNHDLYLSKASKILKGFLFYSSFPMIWFLLIKLALPKSVLGLAVLYYLFSSLHLWISLASPTSVLGSFSREYWASSFYYEFLSSNFADICLRPYTMILYRYGFTEPNNWVHLDMSNLCIYI